jgi:hypothetical protein
MTPDLPVRALERPPMPGGRRWRPSPLIGTIGALGVLLSLALAACSGGAPSSNDVATLNDPSASPDASPSASLDPEAAMDAFAKCMRQHGVDIQISTNDSGDGGFVSSGSGPDASGPPKVAGNDKDKASFDAANKACAPLLPKGGVNGPGGQIDPEMEQKMLAFSACMREHGIDMPDPKFENGGATVQLGGDGSNVDPSSQAFKDAQEACKSLMPGPLDGKGGGGGPVTQGSQP